jgi:hypothetical protein
MSIMDERQINSRSDELTSFWKDRNKKIGDWYDQLRMVDRYAQKNMESFVGNDPRAAFNLLLSILDQPIPHRIDPQLLTREQVSAASDLSKLFDFYWHRVKQDYRLRGKDWSRDFFSFMLISGMFVVCSMPSLDGSRLYAEVWNPVTAYPFWADTLVEFLHEDAISGIAVKRMALQNKWNVNKVSTSGNKLRDYWYVDDGGKIHNSVIINGQTVKPDTLHPHFLRIPVFVEPVGGLPDEGKMSTRAKYTQELGQSFLATNENIYKYYDKWWTFLLQILRDVAQPRTYEKTNSGTTIAKREDWERRGAHFKMGVQDDLGYITPPPMPVELRSTQIDLEAALQRGGPNFSMYGATQSSMSSFLLDNVIASTNQAAKAFHQGAIHCIGDIDNFWWQLINEHGYKPYERDIPKGLPEEFEILADYELRIPGDLTQRATAARMLNPDFVLSTERTMSMLFPEIKNPIEEDIRRRAEEARRDPVFAQLVVVDALREEARMLAEAGAHDSAKLFESVARRKEQEIMGQMQQGQDTGQSLIPGLSPQSMPPSQSSQVNQLLGGQQ